MAKNRILNKLLGDIHVGLMRGDGYALSDIRDQANVLLQDDKVTNRELKVIFCAKYDDSISFSIPQEKNKSVMIYMTSVVNEKMADRIRASDPIDECANLRSSLLSFDFGLQDKFCDASELENAWRNIIIPG